MMLCVVLTRHAFERIFERFSKKPDYRAIVNFVESVIRDGLVLEREGDVKISTSNYTFCCKFDGGKLIIKTVMRTEDMSEGFKRALRYAKKSEWKNIYVENRRQIERWCKEAEKMRNVCKICGISRNQTRIERCRIYGFYVCRYCCEVIGFGSKKCEGCAFYVKPKVPEESSCYIL